VYSVHCRYQPAERPARSGRIGTLGNGTAVAVPFARSIRTAPPKGSAVKQMKIAVVATLVAGTLGLQPQIAGAQDRDRRDRYEARHDDSWGRDDRRDDDRYDRRTARRDSRHDRDRRYDRDHRRYDAAHRDDYRYRPHRLGRNDRIYRGYDDRYYCRRDDGTKGMIVGGIAGGVLGGIIARGDSKPLGAIIGASAGALIGRAIDDGVECR
jgi:hypothetical protein